MNKEIDNEQELIDFEVGDNGLHNSCELIFGKKNGEQWGDDWNDSPYEHNSGRAYDEFVENKFHFKLNNYHKKNNWSLRSE